MKAIAAVVCLLAFYSFAKAFNVEEFNRDYCETTDNGNEVKCTSFNFGRLDDKAFQNESFVISNATKVHLRFCTLATFNENFVNKFPKAEILIVDACLLDLNNLHTPLSEVNTKLQTLTFVRANIYEDNASTGFSYLTGLKNFNFQGYYVSSNGISNTWFENNINLVNIEISDVELSYIDVNAFTNLQQLETVNITDTGLNALPTGLFKNNNNLHTLVFNNEYVPLP